MVAGCASGGETAEPAKPSPPSPSPAAAPSDRVAPRWEQVARFSGIGDQQTDDVEIAAHAIQWRVTAACAGEALSVTLVPEPEAMAEPACPGRAFGFSIRTGPAALDVAATGGWEIVVEQQVDTPLSEPPMEGMTDGSRLARGEFYGIDQAATGKAELYQLPDGRKALRFDPFQVTANTDLFVWLSAEEEPTTSRDAFVSDHVQIDALRATAGAQNYVLPEDVPARLMKSVVVWCEPVRTAYAAARLSD